MRSLILKSALAAILVSASLSGAYAAGDHHSGSREHRGFNNTPGSADHSDYFGDMTMGPPGVPSVSPPHATAPMMAQVIVRQPEFRPRIARIDRELGTANRRIAADRDRGYLTAAEYHVLRARSHTIRVEAQQVAERHDGALPTASYDALQGQVAMLDRTIHRDATT